jgi:hypothetical protein
LLNREVQLNHRNGGERLQYTIEARPLTSEATQRPSAAPESSSTTIEADDAGEALSYFMRDNDSELVSFQPTPGRESIATIRRRDAVFLVRVYTN